MKPITATAAAFLVAVLAFFAVTTKAQDFNPLEKTFLTFSNSVELPGMTLPAGTYTFKLADTPGRNVVQVLSRDEKTVHGQFLFVQAKRPEATSDTVVMFKETAEGVTPAVQYWYYPGESIGKEFVYPKDQATKIAARTHTKVLSTDGEITANSRVSSVDDSGRVAAFEAPVNTPAVQQRAESVQPAPAPPAFQAAPAPARPVTVDQAPRAEAPERVASAALPQTASPLPVTALLGLFSLAAGLGLRASRS